MELFTEWKESENKRIQWVYDDDYTPIGSYACETEKETKEAEEWELERLRDGRLVALGCIQEHRCGECSQWVEDDSLWGIVIEPDETKLREFFKECM